MFVADVICIYNSSLLYSHISYITNLAKCKQWQQNEKQIEDPQIIILNTNNNGSSIIIEDS